MSPRALLLVPLALAAGGAVFALGPYGELTARLDPLRPLDEAPAATWAEAQRLFAALGPEGRELYREHFSWDLVFIAANAAAFLLLLAVPLARLGAPRWARAALLALPLLAAACDVLENVAVARMLAGWEDPQETWLAVAGAATRTKLAANGLAALAVLGAFGLWGIRSLRSRGENTEPGMFHHSRAPSLPRQER